MGLKSFKEKGIMGGLERIGADYKGNGKCEFTVWAPFAQTVDVIIVSQEKMIIPMQKKRSGFWTAGFERIFAGDTYLICLDRTKERPDPASHYQPQGVHGPSQIVDHQTFNWTDSGWKGIPLQEMIMYELHTGTFTPEGKFDAIIHRLDDLKEIGINAIEIMPVSQFPGDRNWGYDGVYIYAVQNSYG